VLWLLSGPLEFSLQTLEYYASIPPKIYETNHNLSSSEMIARILYSS